MHQLTLYWAGSPVRLGLGLRKKQQEPISCIICETYQHLGNLHVVYFPVAAICCSVARAALTTLHKPVMRGFALPLHLLSWVIFNKGQYRKEDQYMLSSRSSGREAFFTFSFTFSSDNIGLGLALSFQIKNYLGSWCHCKLMQILI